MIQPTKELQGQLDRLSKSGSFAVSMTLKKELAELTKKIGCTILVNLDCGTCVRKAMHDVNYYMNRSKSKPVLEFKGVKSIESMTYKELRKMAKDKGHRIKNPTKELLIKLLS